MFIFITLLLHYYCNNFLDADFYVSGCGFNHPSARGFNDTLGCYGAFCDEYCGLLAGDYCSLSRGTFLYVCALFSEIN